MITYDTCPKCGKARDMRSHKAKSPCFDCRRNIAHELMQLGISVRTANAMALSGRLMEWTDFAKYPAGSWICDGIGRVGRKEIAAAMKAYESDKTQAKCEHRNGLLDAAKIAAMVLMLDATNSPVEAKARRVAIDWLNDEIAKAESEAGK